ncbi:MAG TPA: TIGR03435 family protein [Bryobacteraceae bacterium]|jgi:uncharacterized protein (TIGR03435 family)
MIRSAVVLGLYAGLGASAQNNDRLQFEAATIKPTPPYKGGPNMQGCRGGPQMGDPVAFSCIGAPLSILVGLAYRVPAYRLSAPGWMQGQMFDVNTKIPENTTRDEFFVMLQNLLKDRFKLEVHHESREIEQYDLVVAKNGPKIKEVSAPPPGLRPDGTAALFKSGCPAIPAGTLAGNINGQKVMYDPAVDMGIFASRLVTELQTPVRDMTSLKGRYEVALCWAPESSPPDSGPTLMDAVRDQLGLRLESRKAPADFLVVDHIDKSPTAN